jgi:hypothetical protein
MPVRQYVHKQHEKNLLALKVYFLKRRFPKEQESFAICIFMHKIRIKKTVFALAGL